MIYTAHALMDGILPRRRSNSQKAWTQGANVITQKSSYSQQQQNGAASQQKSVASPKPMAKESNTPDSHAHDRLIFLLTSFIVRS
jgi:hypothetical protein